MKYWILLLICFVGFGCANTPGPRTAVPWYEDLNPATDQTLSDWSILDLDTATYQRESPVYRDVWDETLRTLW